MEITRENIPVFWEKNYPLTLSLSMSVVTFFITQHIDSSSLLTSNLASIITISITIIGFLVTIFTVMNSISSKSFIAVKEGDAYQRLKKYGYVAVNSNAVLIALIIGVKVLSSIHSNLIHGWIGHLLSFENLCFVTLIILAYSLLCSFRFIRLVLLLIV